jgi:hypothetical protein
MECVYPDAEADEDKKREKKKASMRGRPCS